MRIAIIGEIPEVHQRSFADALEVPSPEFFDGLEMVERTVDLHRPDQTIPCALEVLRMGIAIVNSEIEPTEDVTRIIRRKRGDSMPTGHRTNIPALWMYTPSADEVDLAMPAHAEGYIGGISTEGKGRLLTDFYRLQFADLVRIEHRSWRAPNQARVQEGMDMTQVPHSSLDTYSKPLVGV